MSQASYIKNPNPQGKGLVPVLQDWHALQANPGGSKAPAVFLRDYCISSLVLAARFGFRPVVGRTYYLYAGEPDWILSLVSDNEWGARAPGDFVGECRLRSDMTWELRADLEEQSAVSERIRAFIDAFVETLSAQGSIAASLPYYAANLPYYQRMLGTALAASLQHSVRDAESEETVQLLVRDQQALLSALTEVDSAL